MPSPAISLPRKESFPLKGCFPAIFLFSVRLVELWFFPVENHYFIFGAVGRALVLTVGNHYFIFGAVA